MRLAHSSSFWAQSFCEFITLTTHPNPARRSPHLVLAVLVKHPRHDLGSGRGRGGSRGRRHSGAHPQARVPGAPLRSRVQLVCMPYVCSESVCSRARRAPHPRVCVHVGRGDVLAGTNDLLDGLGGGGRRVRTCWMEGQGSQPRIHSASPPHQKQALLSQTPASSSLSHK